MELDNCDDLQWFEPDNIPDNTIPYIKQAISCIKEDAVYSEYGFSTREELKDKLRI